MPSLKPDEYLVCRQCGKACAAKRGDVFRDAAVYHPACYLEHLRTEYHNATCDDKRERIQGEGRALKKVLASLGRTV